MAEAVFALRAAGKIRTSRIHRKRDGRQPFQTQGHRVEADLGADQPCRRIRSCPIHCYHQGAIFGGLVPRVLVYFATTYNLGFAIPMLVSTVIAAASVVISLLLSPETKGKVLVSDLVVA